MFLTKKNLLKIVLVGLGYIIAASACILTSKFLEDTGVGDGFLFYLGIIMYVLCPIVVYCGYYTESRGNLINLGNKLVRNELKPAEFIEKYENAQNAEGLIVKKSCFDVLQFVLLAYDCMGNTEKALEVVDEMKADGKESRRKLAELLESSILFSSGKVNEGEAIFTRMRSEKLDFRCTSFADTIFKTDRAMAMGDYRTVEAYALKMLEQKLPKPDNLAKLTLNYMLGAAYEKLGEKEKAIVYYKVCLEIGGETVYGSDAASALEKLQNIS